MRFLFESEGQHLVLRVRVPGMSKGLAWEEADESPDHSQCGRRKESEGVGNMRGGGREALF